MKKIILLTLMLIHNLALANKTFEVNLNAGTSTKLNFNIAMTDRIFIGPTLASSKLYGNSIGLNVTGYLNRFEESSFFLGTELMRYKNGYNEAKQNGSNVDLYLVDVDGIEAKILFGYQYVFIDTHAVIASADIQFLNQEGSKSERYGATNLYGSGIEYQDGSRNAVQVYIGYGYKF